MSYLYRCTRTVNGIRHFIRRSLPKRIEEYINPPCCPVCKEPFKYVDKWQRKKNRDSDNLCYCDGLWFTERGSPHRAGSSVWCKQHPTGPTEQDYIDRYGE